MTSTKLHRIGTQPTLNRQRANKAFPSSLMTLRFPHEMDMPKLFSCKECEKEFSEGETILDGVKMDGTQLEY